MSILGGEVRLVTWNIGTMMSKTMKLADVMRRRTEDIVCLKETKWKGGKTTKLGEGYKLFYLGGDGTRNVVGII